jgi:hypothetical protein
MHGVSDSMDSGRLCVQLIVDPRKAKSDADDLRINNPLSLEDDVRLCA